MRALKVASAGGTVPNGIHVNKILHFTQGQGGGTLNLQAPVTGNLRVLAFSLAGSVSSITDNDTGSSWTIEPQSDNPAAVIAFSPNRGPLSMLSLTVHWGSINYPTSMRFFDVQGAAAAPFDAVASVPSNVACAAPSVANSPTITPTTTNGLTIAGMPFGQGPGTGVTGPPNAIWDLTNYTGESDFDSMENADAVGHFYNPTLAAESWTWTFGPVSSGSCQGAQAVHFSAAD